MTCNRHVIVAKPQFHTQIINEKWQSLPMVVSKYDFQYKFTIKPKFEIIEMNDVELCVALFSVIVILDHVTTGTVTQKNFYRRFKTTHNDSEITASCRLACVVKCIKIVKCLAIRFNANTMTCIRTHRRILNITEGEDDKVTIIRSAPGKC